MPLFKSKTTEDTKASGKKTTAKETKAKEPKKAASMKDLYDGKDQAKAPAKGANEKAAAKRGMAYRILVKPLITEKAATLTTESKYCFEVSTKANKIEISDAIADVYGITPVAINIVTMKGKRKRHGRIMGQRKDWKKAIVTLPKGKTINIYEGV